jgi:predicted phosphodiesterase
MKLQLISDLHFEFHADKGASFVNSLNPEGVDVLVVAGDLAVGEQISDALGLICRRYKDAHVVYVHGNHEFYMSDRRSVLRETRKARELNDNLHWLDGHTIEISGQRFLGTTLWFREDPKARPYEGHLNDFHVIRDFRAWVYEENRRARIFLEEDLREGDVVITHHLPVPEAIHPKYRGSPLNAFFLCDMSQLIADRKPKLWMHGHTHSSVDRTLESGTRVLCNPFGYVSHELNAEFQDSLVVDL